MSTEGEAEQPQWPKCQHYKKVKTLKGYWSIKNCLEDALGFCEICQIDACTDHMQKYHSHQMGLPPHKGDNL